MKRSLWQKLRDEPIIIAWFGVWFVVAALNFHAGIKTGGYPLAIAFVCLAMLGAYASLELDGADRARRAGLSVSCVSAGSRKRLAGSAAMRNGGVIHEQSCEGSGARC